MAAIGRAEGDKMHFLNEPSRGLNRRDLIKAGALLSAGVASSGDALGQAAAPANPLTPLPMPEQAPAKEAIAELADTRLWYWDTGGAGEPIVLLHPVSGSGLVWGYQQPAFAKAGYRVIGYSRRGHHGSAAVDHDKPGVGSEDLQHLVDFLGIAKFHAVSSAAGGGVASDYAFSHPERLLSLTVSSNSFNVRDGEILAANARIRLKNFDELPVEYREVGPSYRAANAAGLRMWVELNHKSLVGELFRQPFANQVTDAMLRKLAVPTLLISGAADLATPPSIARMLAARIPNSELVIASESGHSVYWEQPDVFNRAVLDFIGRHRG
jgi:pimeloyl-ACP methyl ester carboxylesterase